MLILYRKRETKKCPSAQKQELKKLHNTSEVYHSSSSLGSEGGGPHLFHDLKPLSRESGHTAVSFRRADLPGAAFSLLPEGGSVRAAFPAPAVTSSGFSDPELSAPGPPLHRAVSRSSPLASPDTVSTQQGLTPVRL